MELAQVLRDAYGRNPFGQGCLLARRLVERGVSFVLATDMRAGMSYFRAEVQYLLKNGYEYGTANGMKALVKKP